MTDQAISTFRQNLRGRLISPGDPDYDAARALYNGMIDKRPRFIACCVDVADVIAAVNFGREQGLLIAVRGGGHSGPGLGSCDDGLVIDLSLMKSVRVDPASQTVRVDAGCTSGDVDHAIHAFRLAVPFVNFMMDDEADGRVQATYGENYKRLVSVKARYDPKNLFKVKPEHPAGRALRPAV